MKYTSPSYLILSESKIDFKYKSIWQRIPEVEVKEGGFVHLLKICFKSHSNKIIVYHIRYLKTGPRAFIRYLIVCVLSLFGAFDIVWSCHNIEEHNFKYYSYNKILRRIIFARAKAIIVFHASLIKYLPYSSKKKIFVASFGNMQPFVKEQSEENPKFRERLSDWRPALPENLLLSISAAKKSNLAFLLRGASKIGARAIIVAPGVSSPENYDKRSVLFYNQDFVKKEIQNLLLQERCIGYVGHENTSVPTSLYMYASFGVPVIGINKEPVSSLINEYKIGAVISSEDEFSSAYQYILSNYNTLARNCSLFLAQNSWDRSAHVHQDLLRSL